MSVIEDTLDALKGEVSQEIREQLGELLASAASDTRSIVKDTSAKIAEWILMRSQGRLTDEEFEALLYSRDQVLRAHKNTLNIQARARFEKIAVGLVNLVLDKLVGVAFRK